MIAISRTILPAAACVVVLGCAAPGTPLTDPPVATLEPGDPQATIARITSSLRPAVRIAGRDYSPVGLKTRMAELGLPAVSVAVVRDGRIEWARAWGEADPATGEPATAGTLFQAASMSKPVAAMAALALVEEGALALDEDVNRWLSRWKVPSHTWETEHPVTLRRLLSHTAGLNVHGFPGYPANAAVPTVEEVLAGAGPANTDPVTVVSRPGETWRYSGGGTTVVQLLVEEVTGVPFERHLEERVLRPLGMDASSYAQPLPAGMTERAATAHRAGARAVPGRYHTYPEMAAAGLWTTATDLARWVIAVQRSLGGDTTGILSPEMARAMITPQEGPHGLGPQVEGEGDALRFLHGGANEGFRGIFFGFANGRGGAVILTNGDAGSTIASELLLAIGEEYGWPGLEPTEIVQVSVPAERLREYAGRYGSADQPFRVAVEAGEGVIYLDAGDGVRREFVPVGDDLFRGVPDGMAASFERDEQGGLAALQVAGIRLPRQ
jgi:CubicO group peptidase (beta-lactamase class C family)